MIINKNLREKCGIYLLFNTINGKRYVGSSINIYNRLHEHVCLLKTNKAHNKHLQAAWNKYPEDSFVFTVLEYCSKEKQFEREQYYIDMIQPEYNLTLNVIANTGHAVSDEVKNKISSTLKEKYASGEIVTYKQDHAWVKCYIYNIRTLKIEAECKNLADAFTLLKDKHKSFIEGKIYSKRYIISKTKFDNTNELVNYINEIVLTAQSIFGKYIITESSNGDLTYYRNLAECARGVFSNQSTLSKHTDATKENPYTIRNSNYKFYYSNIYIPVTINAAPIEQSLELKSGNIGENPKKDNTEINI